MKLAESVRIETRFGRAVMLEELARLRRDERSSYDEYLRDSVGQLSPDEACDVLARIGTEVRREARNL